MKIRFCGDVHGHYRAYKRLIEDCPVSIQVGDMGVGFKYWEPHANELRSAANPPYRTMVERGDHRFIRGNHDNPEVCKTQSLWIPDGTLVHDRVFCVGGAVSIDRAYRTEGLDWWPDEELSTSELDRVVDDFVALKPEVVCTHDCPDFVANEYLAWKNRAKIVDGSRTRQALDAAYALVERKPRLWLFGHWHDTCHFVRTGTHFQMLGELDYCDVEWLDDDRITVTLSDGTSYEA